MPRLVVTVNNWGRRGWRVSLYQPADIKAQGWSALGRRLDEQVCRTEAAARRLAARWTADNGAEHSPPDEEQCTHPRCIGPRHNPPEGTNHDP